MTFNKFDEMMKQASEEQIRDLVGAPTIEESETCICGEPLDSSHMACYEHMTSGY